MDLHVFPILSPPPTSLPIPSLWVFPVHQPRTFVSCIKPGLAICFTIDNIHFSMLFSQIIPPLPSPTESKSLVCSIHLCLFFCLAYRIIVNIFLNSISFLMRWMKLQPMIQSEVSQKDKDQYSILMYIYGI